MTNEEAKEVLISILRDINSESDGFEYTSEQFTEAMLIAIDVLSKPSLPSDIDEAARKYRNFREECGIGGPVMLNEIEEAHYAGAEWMAGQFQEIKAEELVDWYSTSDGKEYCCGVKTNNSFEVPEGFYIKKK